MGSRGQYSTTARMPRFRHVIITRKKLKDYILSPLNPEGKAAFFKSIGYTYKNADKFKKHLLEGLKHNKAFVYEKNKRGDVAISVIMELGITKKVECVTAWVIKKGEKNPHFVTAYPRKKKKN